MKTQEKKITEYVLTHDEAVTVFRALEYTHHRQLKHNKAAHIASLQVQRLLIEFKIDLGY